MAIYTLVITGAADGHQHVTTTEFASEQALIADTRDLLTAEHTSIALGRGYADAVEFIGVWDWCDGAPRWTPEE